MTNKFIYIIGHQRLQNEMMARILEEETGASCQCIESIPDVPSMDKENPHKRKLVLWDFMGKHLSVFFITLDSETREALSGVPLVLFNVTPGLGIEENAARHGVRGFFYEHDQLDSFIKGVKAVLNGELWLSRKIMTKFVMDQDIVSSKVKRILTPREIEILSLIAVGASNEEVSEKLFISPYTVRTHLYNIFKKINVKNRLQAALWATKNM